MASYERIIAPSCCYRSCRSIIPNCFFFMGPFSPHCCCRLTSISATTVIIITMLWTARIGQRGGCRAFSIQEHGRTSGCCRSMMMTSTSSARRYDRPLQKEEEERRRRRQQQQRQLRRYCASTQDDHHAVTSMGGAATVDSIASKNDDTPRPPRMKTSQIKLETLPEHPVTIMGWVRTIRKQKTLAFLQVNDGSSLAGIQCVVNLVNDKEEEGENVLKNDTTISKILDGITTGAAVEIQGTIIASQGGKQQPQSYEVAVSKIILIGPCPGETYPLAKKRHSLEYLRTIAHLRPRTNTIAAIARVRSQLAGAIHSFFQSSGVIYIQTPLITSSDCEGAGEMFRVTTLNIDYPDTLPILKNKNSKNNSTTSPSKTEEVVQQQPQRRLDTRQDFFNKAAYLTVSGQLSAETYACALGDVYTFGPTFRAENSQTTRHLAEFHMVEPELAFCNLYGVMDNAEQMIQYVIRHVLTHCREDLDFFNNFYDKGLLNRLQKLVDEPFVRIKYKDAIQHLQEEIAKEPSKWQFPNVEFGTDLATEHERWLAETKFQTAVFVYNYPRAIKSFYMRDNDEEDDDETVAAMDLLVPGVGELIGGSQREDRLDVLIMKMETLNLDPDDYWWYLDLRRFGSVPHSGYGMGFERLVTYVCGMENIREAIAFPRYPGNAEF